MSKSTKTTNSLRIANVIRAVVILVTTGVLVFVMSESRDHITHFWAWMGLTTDKADDMWIVIDIPIVIGKLLALFFFDKKTKRNGFWMMFTGIAASLACNVGAGFVAGNLGEIAKGVIIVGLAIALERVLVNLRFAAWVTGAKTKLANKEAAVKATAAVSPQKKAALTRAANKAAAAALAASTTTPAAVQIGSARP